MGKNILIITGETSGDIVTSPLIRELKKLNPEINFWGIGGTTIHETGCEIILDIKELSVMGISDVMKKIFIVHNLISRLINECKKQKPDMAILVDFPGFNMKLASKLKRLGIKTVYYVTPQIWAWNYRRIKKIKKYFDILIPILPFEPAIFKHENTESHYFGHPLIDIVKPKISESGFREKNNIQGDFITLMPGSRISEIKYILPILLKSFKAIRDKLNTSGVLIIAPNIPQKYYKDAEKIEGLKIIQGPAYEPLFYGKIALVASGTATLECAISGIPPIVVYKTDFLTYNVLSKLVKIPYISLVNIIAEQKVVPEFIQNDANPDDIVSTAYLMLQDKDILINVKAHLRYVKSLLGKSGSAERTAQFLNEQLDLK